MFKPIESSIIQDMKYSYGSKELYVQLRYPSDRPWYAYSNVPLEVYERFEQAESKGIFFNTEIKPNYQSRKV